MLCQECQQRQASVHLTKIVNNNKMEIHLCKECARRREDVVSITPFSVNDLLASFMDMGKAHPGVDKTAGVRCPECGMDYLQFKKSGRLGCKSCYRSFARELLPVLRKIQGRTEHTGKVPRRAGVGIVMRKEILSLREALKKAVDNEAFEEAAEIRDRIKDLERQWQGGMEK